jgi:hypothetical protein
MSIEWISTFASLATLLLIAASAVAALLQMRHMHSSNQLLALTEVRETMESPEYRAALLYVLRELPKVMDDPVARQQLLIRPLPENFLAVRTVSTFFESLGVFVKRKALAGSITCDMWGDVVLTCWRRLGPLIANQRHAAGNPALYENFEYLAVLSQRFKERHPRGAYPRGMQRMPASEIWAETRQVNRPQTPD